MKYAITVNQLTWKKYCPKADVRHVFIFESIKSICNSTSKRMKKDNEGYTWIASNLLLKEIPLLKIKTKSGLTPIIKKLTEWNLIDLKIDETTNYRYYKLTEFSDLLARQDLSREEINEVFTNMNGGVNSNERGCTNKCTYHITNDPDTINPITKINIIRENEKTFHDYTFFNYFSKRSNPYDCFCYYSDIIYDYFDNYAYTFKKVHPSLKNDQMLKIVNLINTNFDEVLTKGDYDDRCLRWWSGKVKTDYNLNHFVDWIAGLDNCMQTD